MLTRIPLQDAETWAALFGLKFVRWNGWAICRRRTVERILANYGPVPRHLFNNQPQPHYSDT